MPASRLPPQGNPILLCERFKQALDMLDHANVMASIMGDDDRLHILRAKASGKLNAMGFRTESIDERTEEFSLKAVR